MEAELSKWVKETESGKAWKEYKRQLAMEYWDSTFGPMPGIYDHLNDTEVSWAEEAVPSSRDNEVATAGRQAIAKKVTETAYKENSGSDHGEDTEASTHDGDRSCSNAELSGLDQDSEDVTLDDESLLLSHESGGEEHDAEILDDYADVLTGQKSNARTYEEYLATENDTRVDTVGVAPDEGRSDDTGANATVEGYEVSKRYKRQ
ncbi:uncharacterized protein ColSpa_02575 [Colletotrichum spaethianum]|uniref:Uncharacterized protein n=1 Tax=Colletotrichum spaethianum TaxID=700344 RepID=A0AA37P772_9PEZI|nr:uncharacterized protein ColSpa_02575 [Colletotrichum spaethianum]GKT42394.1 hypothetical protein ColSpa_02575 [Colletotrichum spaethianum]